MNKKQQLEQFFSNVKLTNLSYWHFSYNLTNYRILDYTLSEILSRDLDKSGLKSDLLYYSTKI